MDTWNEPDEKGFKPGDEIVWDWPVSNAKIARGKPYTVHKATERGVTILIDGVPNTWGHKPWRYFRPKPLMDGGSDEYDMAMAGQALLEELEDAAMEYEEAMAAQELLEER